MEPHGSKESYSFLKQMWTVKITTEGNNRLKQSLSSEVKQGKVKFIFVLLCILISSITDQGHQSHFWLHTTGFVCLYFCFWTWPVRIDDNWWLELYYTRTLLERDFCVFSMSFCTLSLEIPQVKKMVFGFVLWHVLMTSLKHPFSSSQSNEFFFLALFLRIHNLQYLLVFIIFYIHNLLFVRHYLLFESACYML